jgi:hypothetical protein
MVGVPADNHDRRGGRVVNRTFSPVTPLHDHNFCLTCREIELDRWSMGRRDSRAFPPKGDLTGDDCRCDVELGVEEDKIGHAAGGN